MAGLINIVPGTCLATAWHPNGAAPVVREILRKSEDNPNQRPAIHVGG